MNPEEARRRASLEFGGLEQTKEHVRDTHWETHLEDLFRDFRFALAACYVPARRAARVVALR